MIFAERKFKLSCNNISFPQRLFFFFFLESLSRCVTHGVQKSICAHNLHPLLEELSESFFIFLFFLARESFWATVSYGVIYSFTAEADSMVGKVMLS